jgi:hypothetical protein
MAAQLCLNGPKATHADERHHQVDRVGRLDLSTNLVQHPGFAGGVRQQRCVEDGKQRLGRQSHRPVRETLTDRMQDRAVSDRRLHARIGASHMLVHQRENRSGERNADFDAVLVGDGIQRHFNLPRDVRGDPIRRIVGAELSHSRQVAWQRGDLVGDQPRYEPIVKAAFEVGHPSSMP